MWRCVASDGELRNWEGFAETNTKTTQIEAADVTKAKVLRNMVPNEYSDFCSVMYLVTSSYRTMCDEKKKKTFK